MDINESEVLDKVLNELLEDEVVEELKKDNNEEEKKEKKEVKKRKTNKKATTKKTTKKTKKSAVKKTTTKNKTKKATKRTRTKKTKLDIDESIKIKFLIALSYDMSIEEAAAHSGITRQTIYNYIEKGLITKEEIEQAKDKSFSQAKETLFKAIEGGERKAAVEYLKRRDKNYKDKVEQDINGNLNVNIELGVLTDEEEEEIKNETGRTD